MKHIHTFERFLNESYKTLNETKAPKNAGELEKNLKKDKSGKMVIDQDAIDLIKLMYQAHPDTKKAIEKMSDKEVADRFIGSRDKDFVVELNEASAIWKRRI